MSKGDPIIPRVWITQYAMSGNVFTVSEVEHCTTISDKMIAWSEPDNHGSRRTCHKPDWHTTREEAVAHVKLLKIKKVISLKKQQAKVQAIDPETLVPE